MKRTVAVLSALTRRFPWLVLAAVAVITVVLAGFMSQAEISTGQEGFAPDTPEIQAAEEIGDLFSTGSSEDVVQFILEGDDVITADALRLVEKIQETVSTSDVAPYLSDRPDRPAVVSYLGGVQRAAQMQGVPTSQLTDAQVKQIYTMALSQAPADQADYLKRLVSTRGDVEQAAAPAGLVLVFIDVSKLPATGEDRFNDLINIEKGLASSVEPLATDDLTIKAFSMNLLFGEGTDFQKEVQRLFIEAFLIILLILGYVYFLRPRGGRTWEGSLRRTVADVALTLGVIVTAIIWMQGIGVLIGPKYLGIIGQFNQITQIIPVLLIGLGVDYAIHLTGRYREEIGVDESVDEAISRTISTVGVALILATVTTAVGFLTNLISPIPGLKDFGILTAIGITVAFILMLTMLPAVRLLLDRRAERHGRLHPEAFAAGSTERALPRVIAKTAVLAERLPVITLVIALALGGVGVYGLTQLETTFSFTDFLPKDSPSVQALHTIQDEFGGGFGEQTNVLIKGDLGTAAAYNAMVEAWDNLAGVPDVKEFGGRAAAESPVTVIAQLAQSGDPSFLQVLQKVGYGPDLKVDPGVDVRLLYEAASGAVPEEMGRVLHRDPDGAYTAALFTIQTGSGEERAVELRDNLLTAFAPLETLGNTVLPTSESIISGAVVQSLQSSQLRSLLFTLIIAMLLLMANFWFESRRPFLGVITIAPVALVVLWTFAMMAALGISFNPITATLSAIAIGIGVPFTIHVTHRYEEDRARFETTEEAIRSTARHTGAALAGSAFTTMAGFGVLISSSLVPLQQMGEVTVIALGFALIGAILVLPSMLVLWDDWHRRRGETAFDRARLAEHGYIDETLVRPSE